MAAKKLKHESLKVRAESITVGPMHSRVLKEKLNEYEGKLAMSAEIMDREAREYR